MDVPAARRVRHRNDRCNRPGFLYNPKTQDINSRDALAGVCVLQLAGRYILAGVDCRADVPDGPEEQDTARSYFILDTGTGRRSDFATYEALRSAAAQMNIQVQ